MPTVRGTDRYHEANSRFLNFANAHKTLLIPSAFPLMDCKFCILKLLFVKFIILVMRSTSTVRLQIRHISIKFHKDKKTVLIVTLVIKI